MKAIAVTEAILTVGMVVITSIMIATQIPGMINDIKQVLSKESVGEKSQELANLLSIATSSPNEIKMIYALSSEKSYDISINNGYVNVSSDSEWATAKTLVLIDFSKPNVQTLTITKTSDGVVKVE